MAAQAYRGIMMREWSFVPDEAVRNMVDRESDGMRRCLGPAAVVAGLLAAAACVTLASYAVPKSEVSQQVQMVGIESCMPQCPRRLGEDNAKAFESCLSKCPSDGFMAVQQFEACKVTCERKHPVSGKMAGMPEAGPPMEGCKKQCAEQHHSGNFWRLMYERCANKCAVKTAADEVVFQIKYNISNPEMKDLESGVVSVLKKRITFKRRPVNHPYSFLIHQCKTKAENALAQALGIAEGQTPPAVVIRPFKAGAHRVVPEAMMHDPGNDLEAAVNVQALSNEHLEKLSETSTLQSFDDAFKEAIKSDPTTKGLLNMYPALAMELTSVSVPEHFVPMGFHTVCRRNKADTSLDGWGTAKIIKHQTLHSCSKLCDSRKEECYGFEYRAHEKRCEIWSKPICAHSKADIDGASFVDFQCWKRCH